MAKQSKLHIKNTQLADAINLSGLKAKLSRKKAPSGGEEPELIQQPQEQHLEGSVPPQEEVMVKEPPHVNEEPLPVEAVAEVSPPSEPLPEPAVEVREEEKIALPPEPVVEAVTAPVAEKHVVEEQKVPEQIVREVAKAEVPQPPKPKPVPFLSASRENPYKLGPVLDRPPPSTFKPRRREPLPADVARRPGPSGPSGPRPPPSGRYEPLKERTYGPPPRPRPPAPTQEARREPAPAREFNKDRTEKTGTQRSTWKWQNKEKPAEQKKPDLVEPATKKAIKGKPIEVRGVQKKGETGFDSRVRHGIAVCEDDDKYAWRKKRAAKSSRQAEVQEIIRPTKIQVRILISVKDLASEMKLKASQLISTLFLQGTVVTLNDMLDDETMIQLLGHELGCEVEIDRREEDRLRITGQSILEEISSMPADQLIVRPPVVTFMGHVDHGKTSLIDAIRKSNRAQSEVGAITQHIGAFRCMTSQGPITIIDTPGHEAFSAMRERGAGITDLVVLVIAGDEGIKEQTVEALQQAKEAHATILVAINKCDKQNFDQDRVFRQMADQGLLPEAWGGQVVTVRCSALTHEGIPELLELIALQSEVLELRANPHSRARGTVIESEMTKGLGHVATILVRNGTLYPGDCLVFGTQWARVKSMRDELGKELTEAGPSTPVRIHGLSGLPDAGEEFIVVKNEKEAREIAEGRSEGKRQISFQSKRIVSVESIIEKASGAATRKTLNIVLRADVQGSLDAVKTALSKIVSTKVGLNIISFGVGQVSESDIQLASASKAIILGFHTDVEAHAEPIAKALGVSIHLHSIIYHAQDAIKELMRCQLDKIAEEHEKGKAEVKTVFKSSQIGCIAGCQVLDGVITRNSMVRVKRDGAVIWTGPISSLKRFKEDVKEVQKGTECGVVFQNFTLFQEGDILEAFEISYIEPEL